MRTCSVSGFTVFRRRSGYLLPGIRNRLLFRGRDSESISQKRVRDVASQRSCRIS
jgi:hypothetical protein